MLLLLFCYIIEQKHCVDLYNEGLYCRQMDNEGNSALHLAVQNGSLKVFNLSIVNINMSGQQYKQMLMLEYVMIL
jgi:ankyrin repeat protein